MKPLFLLLAGILMLAGTPALPILSRAPGVLLPRVSATAAVYVYEKSDTAIPAGVTAGIDRLNRDRKIVATMLEDDTVDGTGDIPEQYKPAIEAARKSSMPALVVLAGKTVIRVVASPKTEQDVLGAVP